MTKPKGYVVHRTSVAKERELAIEWHVAQLAARGMRCAEMLLLDDIQGAKCEAASLFEMIDKVGDLDDMAKERRVTLAKTLKRDIEASGIPEPAGSYGVGTKVYDRGAHPR